MRPPRVVITPASLRPVAQASAPADPTGPGCPPALGTALRPPWPGPWAQTHCARPPPSPGPHPGSLTPIRARAGPSLVSCHRAPRTGCSCPPSSVLQPCPHGDSWEAGPWNPRRGQRWPCLGQFLAGRGTRARSCHARTWAHQAPGRNGHRQLWLQHLLHCGPTGPEEAGPSPFHRRED